MIKFNFQVPIKEAEDSDGETEKEFIIEGTAINATTTGNNHKYLEDELKASANTLTGVPLLKDHRNEVDYIMGRVKKGKYAEKKVEFRAKVIDKNAQEMIKDGRLNSVSVGAMVDRFDEDEDGSYVPRGITFKELSLVAVGADDGATFGMALSEAYKLTTDTKEKKVIEIPKEIADESAPDTVTKEELADTVAKAVDTAVAEALAKKETEDKLKADEKAKAEQIEKEAEEKKLADESAEAKLKETADKKAKEEADLKAKEQAKLEAEEKAAKEAEEEDEKDASEEIAGHKLIESAGALRGGALTIERGD